jgi:hypothetical protein
VKILKSFCTILFVAGLFAITFVCCKTKQAVISENTSVNSAVAVDSSAEEVPWDKFTYTSEDLSFEIDSSNISEFERYGDTIYLSVFPPVGIDAEGKWIKILNPLCDNNSTMLLQGQSRYFVSSMGPDLILDGMLHTALNDTLRYDKDRQGFRIISNIEGEADRFPELDTLAFINSYKHAIGEDLNVEIVAGRTGKSFYEDFLKDDEDLKKAFELSGVETHRLILTLFTPNSRKYVIVFNYGHFG